MLPFPVNSDSFNLPNLESSGFSDFSFSDSNITFPSTTIDPNLKPWQSRPPYMIGDDIQYNNGTVFYVRRTPGTIVVPFFTAYWWLAIIILVVVVVVLYTALCLWICCHFEKSEQKKAKSVVETAYLENGFFDLDEYAEENGLAIKRSLSSRTMGSDESSAPTMRQRHGGGGRNPIQPGSGMMPNPYMKRGSDSDSVDEDPYRSPTGRPDDGDERAFAYDDDNYSENDNVNTYYSNNNSGSSDDEQQLQQFDVDMSSEDSHSGAGNGGSGVYRMPMGRRRSQN